MAKKQASSISPAILVLVVVAVVGIVFYAGLTEGQISSGPSTGSLPGRSTPARSKRVRHVSRADFGDAWPLTVEGGTLRCKRLVIKGVRANLDAVTFEAEGKVYSVNGVASSWKMGREIDPIWAAPEPLMVRNPSPPPEFINVATPKKSIGPLIDAGLALCR